MAALNQISDVVPAFSEYADRLRECLYQVDDIAEEVYAVLDDGEAAGIGRHDELLASCSVYRETYETQYGGEN